MQAKIAKLFLIIGIYQIAQQFALGQDGSVRIKAGHVVSLGDYPYMVNIWRGKDYICGGTLITAKCVLTAAHCVDNGNKDNLRVYGALKSGRLQMAFQSSVDDILLPNGNEDASTDSDKWFYNYEEEAMRTTTSGTPHDVDVALLVLNDHFADTEVTTIDIDSREVEAGDEVIIAGWGSTHYWSTPTAELNVYNSTISPNFVCSFVWGANIANDEKFCVDAKKGKGPCQHDSGGPAIRNGRQVGVLSNIHKCNRLLAPSLHTRLSSRPVQKFIHKSMGNHC